MVAYTLATLRPYVLCIVPPYATDCPPAGAAALLGYLKHHGCDEFDFVDLRLWSPPGYAPTYRNLGAAAENFVIDVPDLPLVLELLRASDEGRPFVGPPGPVFLDYCRRRAIDPAGLHAYMRAMDRFLAAAAARLSGARLVGFTTWTSNLWTTLLAAAHLKRLPRPPLVVAGGPQVSESAASAQLGLRAGLFDLVVRGEGEQALLAISRALSAGHDPRAAQIPGTTAADRPPTPPARQIDLGEVDASFDELPIAAYQHRPGQRSLPFQLSRGCTDRCEFCSEWVFWRHYRSTPGDAALAQVRRLVDRYRASRLRMMDSLLNGHPKRLQAFAEGLLRERLAVRWSGFMRAQIDPESAALLRRAGLDFVFLGVESLDDEVLDAMNKRRSEHDNLRAIETFLAAGIEVCAGIIAGFPGDSPTGFRRTVARLRDLQRRHGRMLSINFEPFMVSPGQPLFARLAEFGLETAGWDPDTLALAPRYLDIAAQVPHTVTGRNQGAERRAQLRVAAEIEQDAAVYHTFRWHDEALGPAAWSRHRVDDRGWRLWLTKTSAAATYALLVAPDEHEALARATLAAAAEPDALVDRPSLRARLDALERAHLVPPSRTPRPRRAGFALEPGPRDSLALSPFVVARLADDELLIATWVGPPAAVAVPAALAPLVEALSQHALDAASIAALLARHAAAAADAWPALRAELLSRGLVVVHDAEPAPARPPGPTPRPRGPSLPVVTRAAQR